MSMRTSTHELQLLMESVLDFSDTTESDMKISIMIEETDNDAFTASLAMEVDRLLEHGVLLAKTMTRELEHGYGDYRRALLDINGNSVGYVNVRNYDAAL